MMALNIVDDVIPEPLGGAHTDIPVAVETVKSVILKNIQELNKMDPKTRIKKRMEKFFNIGIVKE